MLKQLARLFGLTPESASTDTEFDPVYGLPKRAIEEWLERNPRLREEYEVMAWLARNPPLGEEFETAVRQNPQAFRVGDRNLSDRRSPEAQHGDRLGEPVEASGYPT